MLLIMRKAETPAAGGHRAARCPFIEDELVPSSRPDNAAVESLPWPRGKATAIRRRPSGSDRHAGRWSGASGDIRRASRQTAWRVRAWGSPRRAPENRAEPGDDAVVERYGFGDTPGVAGGLCLHTREA